MYEDIASRIENAYGLILDEVNVISSDYNLTKPTIVAVSKTRTDEEVQAAIDTGIHNFGENYAQPFVNRVKSFPDQKWHFIGNLQRRNAKSVASIVHLLHTIDSERLVNRLANLNYRGPALIQVNVSNESTKSGIKFEDDEIGNLLKYAKGKRISILGLMAIGNFSWNKEECLGNYTNLVEMGKNLGLTEYSLGMSSDWKEALLAGATIIRIGTSIFGPRK